MDALLGLVDHACAIDLQGVMSCWGNLIYGQLGTGATVLWGSQSTALLPVAGSHSFVTVSAGGTHSCALTGAGEAYCWGDSGSAQLGIGTPPTGAPPSYSTTPVPVAFRFIFSQIGAGARHACGLGQPVGASEAPRVSRITNRLSRIALPQRPDAALIPR